MRNGQPSEHLVTLAVSGMEHHLAGTARNLAQSSNGDTPSARARRVQAQIIRRLREEIAPNGRLRRSVEAVIRESALDLSGLEATAIEPESNGP